MEFLSEYCPFIKVDLNGNRENKEVGVMGVWNWFEWMFGIFGGFLRWEEVFFCCLRVF